MEKEPRTIEQPSSKHRRKRKDYREGRKMSVGAFLHFWRPLIYALTHILHFVQVEGKENIPKEGGYLVCSNHRGMIDPLLIASFLPRCPYFMAKAELFKIPILRGIIAYAHAFPVHRGSSDIASVQTSVQILKQKDNLLIFPEGTRSKTGVPRSPKPGVAMIAARGECDVLPCAICFSGRPFPFKPIKVVFGPVIAKEELHLNEGRKGEAYTHAVNVIMERIVALLPPVKGKKLRAPRFEHLRGRLSRKKTKKHAEGTSDSSQLKEAES